MSFLLKIVEGPNRGAEIALVSGVAVTLGKGDDCDIVLADSTLPSSALTIEASDAGVTVDGEPLESFAVKTVGATSFAVGPAEGVWKELTWPEKVEQTKEAGESGGGKRDEEPAAPQVSSPAPSGEAETPKKRRGGCFGCLVVMLVVVAVLLGLAYVFRAEVRPYADKVRPYAGKARTYAGRLWKERVEPLWKKNADPVAGGIQPSAHQPSCLSGVAAKYGLSFSETNGVARLYGDLKTRRERLAAMAEAYTVQPGAELDISDEESFRSAAEDALFTLTEGALKVVSATNRTLTIAGVSSSPSSLENTLKALNADMPKLVGVDVRGVRFDVSAGQVAAEANVAAPGGVNVGKAAARTSPEKSSHIGFPVCGLLTVPYPCLVMRDGRRVFKGASIEGGVVVDIGADSVTVTNATGRYTWKP